MKSIAILTMVYDDDIFLKIWLSYWERFVPRSSLYVLIHADYKHYENIAKGCNTIRIARPAMSRDFEVNRWKMLSRIASGLTHLFDRVIYTDVDEIIVLDPKFGNDPVEHILSRPEPVISPFGLDVVEAVELDLPPIDLTKPILSQREFIAPCPYYSKPCITSERIEWCSGGHFCDKEQVFLSDALLLFHLRLFDRDTYNKRAAQRRIMVSDPATGEPVEGLGGSTWRRTDEFSEYFIERDEPLESVDYKKERSKWVRSGKLNGDGFWQRKGKMQKNMSRLPDRFKDVF